MPTLTTLVETAFPANGKVLVVGLDNRQMRLLYGNRVQFRDHWEVSRETDIPPNTEAICLSAKLSTEKQHAIRALASARQIARIEIEHDATGLRTRLRTWLSEPSSGPVEATELPDVQIPDAALTPNEMEGAVRIPTLRIAPDPKQPRTYFSPKKMAELVASIKAIGQQMPVIVSRIKGVPGYDYKLVEGERRLRACIILGIPDMLAVVRTVVDEEDQFMSSFVANFAREGHTAMDTARGINRLLDFKMFNNVGKTEAIQRIANISGKSVTWAQQHLKLLTLSKEIQQWFEPDDNEEVALTLAMGNFLCSIARPDIQLKVAEETVAKGLTMKQARNLARRLAIDAGLKAGSAQRSPDKDYKIMRNFLRYTVEGAENLLTMPHRTLDELFEHRGPKERSDALASIGQAIELLNRLQRAVSLSHAQRKRA